jgi:hypothetical protein
MSAFDEENRVKGLAAFYAMWESCTNEVELDDTLVGYIFNERRGYILENYFTQEVRSLPFGIPHKCITNDGVQYVFLNTRLGPIMATVVMLDGKKCIFISPEMQLMDFGFYTGRGLDFIVMTLRVVFGFSKGVGFCDNNLGNKIEKINTALTTGVK